MKDFLIYPAVAASLLLMLWPAITEARQIRHTAEAEVTAQASTSGEMPFWFRNNRNGHFTDSGQGELYLFNYQLLHDIPSSDWYWSAGLELTGNVFHRPDFLFSQLFIEAGNSDYHLRIGRYPWRSGLHHETLSSGSAGESGNALPIPKIELSTRRYLPLPHTSGYLSFRGHFAHGRLADDRFTHAPLLHEKSFYLRLSLPFRSGIYAYGGIVHYAMWGGESKRYGKLPASTTDFARVLIAVGGDEDAPPGEQNYVLGDHLGFWDIGLKGQIENWSVMFYRHFMFETKKGLLFNTLQDGLLGLSVSLPTEYKYLRSFVWEFLYTKYQNGSIPAGQVPGKSGRVNYYNHGIYQTGWTYHGRVIGNPLMLPYSELPDLEGYGIANNRVVAHHFGLEGLIMEDFIYRLMVTYTRNYGSYMGQDRAAATDQVYPFQNGPRQWYFYAGSEYWIMREPNLSVIYALSMDYGQLFRNRMGIMVGFKLKL